MRDSWRRANRYWDEFFHAECDARVLALLRIGFASLVLVHWVAFLPRVSMLWSVDGMLPLSDLYAVADGFVPTLFSLLPRTDVSVWVGYGLLGFHAVALLVGWRSRLQMVALLVWLVSFQNRNPLVLNGQDALLRMMGVFLAFAPLGARYSLDARRGGAFSSGGSAFPLRLLQLQIAVVMFSAGAWKLRGEDWTSGNALYYVTRLEGFWGNLPVPAALQASERILRAGTFATLALELSVPILIWLPRTRRLALAAALLFHAGLAYTMNLFLFAPIMMLGWCSFLQRADIDGFFRRILLRAAIDHDTSWTKEGKVT